MTSLTNRCYLLRLTSTASTNRPNPSRIPSSARAEASQHQACRSRHSSNPRTSNLNPEIDRSNPPSLQHKHTQLFIWIRSRADPDSIIKHCNRRGTQGCPARCRGNPTTKAIQTTGEEIAARNLVGAQCMYFGGSEAIDRSSGSEPISL